MSRQLSRIRSIISEIEEIQKQGQSEGRAQLPQRETEPMAEVVELRPPVTTIPAPTAEDAEAGRIGIQLTGNVVIALQIENTNETVEIRQVHDSIEIRFTDGKAVHLPLKNVA